MRVLVTGGAGRIGSRFATAAASMFDLRMGDRQPPPVDLDVESADLDVTDPASCDAACAGVEAVLHLAADPSPDADFLSSVLPTNILGTYNIARAAVRAGARRFVFASSVQAVEGYPDDRQVRESDPPWPVNDYGVGKAFGEALCASMAARGGLTVVAVRIGAYTEHRPGASVTLRNRAAWLSPDDAVQVLGLTLTAQLTGHHVVHGISDNLVKRLALDDTRSLLGYAPRDDAFAAQPPATW